VLVVLLSKQDQNVLLAIFLSIKITE